MEKEEVVVVEEVGDGGEVGGVRVLVVDDSYVDRKVVERLMVKSGLKFEVTTVNSGKKAMEVLGLTKDKAAAHTFDVCEQYCLTFVLERKFDMVLTDYCMPEVDGYGLLNAIKENACSATIPVVIMSSENDSQRINRCIANGAEEFIIKPLQTKDLQRLRSYAKPQATLAPKAGTKRKLPLDVITEGNDAARRPRLAGVAVA